MISKGYIMMNMNYFSGGTHFSLFFDFFTFMEVPIVLANLAVYIIIHMLYYYSESKLATPYHFQLSSHYSEQIDY